MKILHVEDFFYPNAGYQINILPKYLQKNGSENIILTSEYSKAPKNLKLFFEEKNIDKKDRLYTNETEVKIIRSSIYGFFSGRAIWNIRKFLKSVKEINPDVIYFHGNDSFISIFYLLFLRKINSNLIFDSHMLEMASKNRFNKLFRIFYRTLITPILIKNRYLVIKVQDTNFLEKSYNLPLSLTPFISFGSDVDLFTPMVQNANVKITQGNKVFMYTGKLNEEKGSMLLVEAFRKKFDNDVTLIIIGNFNDDKFSEKLLERINESENEIILLETQDYVNLPRYYKLADFAIFPKQCSLSFFDLQAMTIPVLFEDNVVNNERKFGINETFKAGNIEDMRNKIDYFANLDDKEYNRLKKKSRENILNNFNYNTLALEYYKYIESSLKNEKL